MNHSAKLSNFIPFQEKHAIEEVLMIVIAEGQLSLEQIEHQEKLKSFSSNYTLRYQNELKISGKEKPNLENSEFLKCGFQYIDSIKENNSQKALVVENTKNNQVAITYATNKYENWQELSEAFVTVLKELIDNINFDEQILAYGLLYRDKFIWQGSESSKFDVSEALNPESKFLPANILYSKTANFKFSFTEEFEKEGLQSYQIDETIDIDISETNSHIKLNHLSLRKSKNYKKISEAITKETIIKFLNSAHTRNKEIFSDVFQEHLCDVVNLNS